MGMYGTIAGAETYFKTRLNTSAWDNAQNLDKTSALTMAAEVIDRLNFLGEKTDENQELQFPRYSDTLVPEDIKKAAYEIALALLDGVNPELEFENLNMISQGYGNVRSTYDRSRPAEHLLAGVPSITAWRYLKPYLRDIYTVDLLRAS